MKPDRKDNPSIQDFRDLVRAGRMLANCVRAELDAAGTAEVKENPILTGHEGTLQRAMTIIERVERKMQK